MSRSDRLGWGFVGTGPMAEAFAEDLSLSNGGCLVATASRSAARAQEFSARFGARKAFETVVELADDPDVDIVYIATPNTYHAEAVSVAIGAGKSVLCEKPVAMDAVTTQRLIEAARGAGVFFAEAMWMRCNPTIRHVMEIVRDGGCGELGEVTAAMGAYRSRDDQQRLWDPALGASSLLNIGIYPVTLACMALGEPMTLTAAASFTAEGFDIGGGATAVHAGGGISSVAWTQIADSHNGACLAGALGRIEIPRPMLVPDRFTFVKGSTTTTYATALRGHGYIYQIEEVERCVKAGLTESPLLPHDGTLLVMRMMDAIADAARMGGRLCRS